MYTKHQVYYFNLETNMVKNSKHVILDEVMNKLEALNSNGKHLGIALGFPIPEAMYDATSLISTTLGYHNSLLPTIKATTVNVACEYGTFGMYIQNFSDIYRM